MLRARYLLAGRPVDPCTTDELALLFQRLAAKGEKLVLANLNLHGLYCTFKSRIMLDLMRDRNTLVHIDGMPILWLCNLLGARLNAQYRNAHIELVIRLMNECERNGQAVFMVASDPAGAIENERTFKSMFPALKIKCKHGFFDVADAEANSRIIEDINAFNTKLLLVGMGMPRQEEWIAAVKDRVSATMIMPVGGFSDYFTGRTKMTPRYLGRWGLEWAYRLMLYPRRMAFRYLVEPIVLFFFLARASINGERWGKDVERGLQI